MDRSIIITGAILIAAMFGCEPSSAHEPDDIWPLESVTDKLTCLEFRDDPNLTITIRWYPGNEAMGIPAFCYSINYPI